MTLVYVDVCKGNSGTAARGDLSRHHTGYRRVKRETRTIPIVFTLGSDPVGSGFVQGLPNPGGNITGFINPESSLVEKWLELLKDVVPRLTRVAIIVQSQTAPYAQYYLGPRKSRAIVWQRIFIPESVQRNRIGGLITDSGESRAVA